MNSVVIGSGFGGIAAALRLKAKGHNVTLIEKHHDLGGRARVFKKNGFTYDGGPTVITAPYLIKIQKTILRYLRLKFGISLYLKIILNSIIPGMKLK